MKHLASLFLLLVLCCPISAQPKHKFWRVLTVPVQKVIWPVMKWPIGAVLRLAILDKNGQVYEVH